MSNATSKRFIAAEYNGRQIAIRRSSNYDMTLTLVKEAFKHLKLVDVERISVSAFVEEIGDSLEISRNIWSDLLPELDCITITIDSASPESDDSDYPSSEEEDERSEDEASEDDDKEIDATELEDLKNDCLSEVPTLEPAHEIPPHSEDESDDYEPGPMNHRRIAKHRASSGAEIPLSLPSQTESDVDPKNRGEYDRHTRANRL
ncbi:polyubiquitin-C [Ceratobasidium sp. AG-Ba]|nr:polyubiquitin-C [Ceratobasidium sp. AG-Ba]